MARQGRQTLRLERGARHLVPVAPGTLVLVRRGAVRLRPPPEWPDHAFTPPGWRLDAEETWAATARGYAELTAIGNAEVALIPAGTWTTQVADRLAALWRLLRRAAARSRLGRAPRMRAR